MAASELWRRWGPETVLEGPTFPISRLLTGRILDSSATSDVLYADLCLQNLPGQYRQTCADIRIAFVPEKTVILKTAEAMAFAAATLLLLDRLTNPAPWTKIDNSHLLDLGLHTVPDVIAVLNADHNLLAATPLTWGGRA